MEMRGSPASLRKERADMRTITTRATDLKPGDVLPHSDATVVAVEPVNGNPDVVDLTLKTSEGNKVLRKTKRALYCVLAEEGR